MYWDLTGSHCLLLHCYSVALIWRRVTELDGSRAALVSPGLQRFASKEIPLLSGEPSSLEAASFSLMQANKSVAKALSLFLSLLIALPGWGVTTTQPQLPDPGSAPMTKQQQEQLGQQAMAQVYQQMPVLPDSSPVSQYVRQLGAKLVKVIPPQHSWPYQFHVVQQKEINAFALPGGPLFINVGTIQAADNEAELVGVMAHEMSHVYMQHSAKQVKQNTVPSILAALGGVLGQVIGGTGGAIAQMGGQIGGGLLSMKYSRKDEAQADQVGAIIMYKAGYNPKAMADFFTKLEKMGGSGPQLLSDHPNPGNREQAIQTEIQNWPPKNYQPNSPAFASAKQQANGVHAYTAQEIANGAKNGQWVKQNKQSGATPANLPAAPGGNGSGGNGNISGVTLKDVQPSGNYKQFTQGPVAIAYPDNWQAAADQQSGLTIAPAAGASQGSIAYGVVINGTQSTNGSSLDQATQQLIQSMEQSNPGLQASGNTSSIKVNGVQGRQVNLMGTSPVEQNGQPLPERDWLVTLPYQQNGMVYLVFIAPQKDFSALRPTYKHMLNSVQLQ